MAFPACIYSHSGVDQDDQFTNVRDIVIMIYIIHQNQLKNCYIYTLESYTCSLPVRTESFEGSIHMHVYRVEYQ